MLLLLPPSEGKTAPNAGDPVDLDVLAFARELGPLRRKVLAATRNAKLKQAPAAPAIEVYTGVLFGRLDYASLSATARERADRDVLIASGLWGLVGPADAIPAYKLPIGTAVPKLGKGLATLWRPAVAKALAARDVEGELVVDLRSGPYLTVWQPTHAGHLHVRAFRVNADGSRSVISHNAKAARGDIARVLLKARKVVRTPEDVAAAAAAAGFEVELGDGVLDVLERPPTA